MTNRSTNQQKTKIEIATEEVVAELNQSIHDTYEKIQPQIDEQHFRRILAGYFEHQTLKDWRELLWIETEEVDKP